MPKDPKGLPAAQALTASPGEEIMEACAKAGSRAVLTVSRCFKHHHISLSYHHCSRICRGFWVVSWDSCIFVQDVQSSSRFCTVTFARWRQQLYHPSECSCFALRNRMIVDDCGWCWSVDMSKPWDKQSWCDKAWGFSVSGLQTHCRLVQLVVACCTFLSRSAWWWRPTKSAFCTRHSNSALRIQLLLREMRIQRMPCPACSSLQQLKSNFKIRDLPVRVSSGAWQHTPTLRQRFPARCQTHECASMVLLTLKNVYTCIYTCIYIYIYTLYYWYYLCSLIPTLFSCQTGLQGSDSRSSAWNDLLPDVHETGRSYQAHWHRKCWPVHAC